MKNRTHFTAMLAILALAFSVVACSSDGGINQDASDTNDPETVDAIPPEIEHFVNPDESFFVGETLTIAVGYKDMLQSFAARYMRENPGVTIEIISLEEDIESDESWGSFREQMGTQLMAGSGPILIDAMLVDPLDPRSSGYFADWFPVMRADPDFVESDWFMSVFHAVSVNDKLLSFPTSFSCEMVVANKIIPGLTEALAERESVMVSELVELQRSISTEGQYLFEPSNNIGRIVIWHYLSDFLDFKNGFVDFNNARFIELLNSHKSIIDRDKTVILGDVVSPDDEALVGENYPFIFQLATQWQYFLDFEESLFTELTPIVNKRGELVMIPFESYVLNTNSTNAEQSLAWDFLKFISDADNNRLYSMGFQPTNRGQHRSNVERFLPQYIDEWIVGQFMWQLNSPVEDMVEEAIARMSLYAEMPMYNALALPDTIYEVLLNAMIDFDDGLVSAEETAANLQNQVELIMMEMGLL